MFANNFSSSAAGWTSIATGAAGLLGLAFIILLFTVGQPFGTLNDICNGLAAVLSAVLAGMLYQKLHAQSPMLSHLTLASAIFAAILALVGSQLAISGVSGWYLAGLYTVTGYALIGFWLLGLTSHALQDHSLPQGLAVFGLITGLILALGLIAIPGIFRGLDDNTYQVTIFNAIWWTSSLAYLTIYPAWCILLGRLLLSGSARIDNAYRITVFLHVISIFGFLLSHSASVSMAFVLKREHDPQKIRPLLHMSSRSYPLMSTTLSASSGCSSGAIR